ncbi:MAG: transporter [Planctomycetes bacterium]|nr:transporter [Planctomycetota bacterium]
MNLRTVRICRFAFVVLASLTFNRAVEAQDASDKSADAMAEPLITDRPDFTESTEAIPAGHFQLEAGYTFTYDREHKDRVRDHTAPEFLLRIGVIDDVELRLGWQGYSWTENQFVTRTRVGRRVTGEDWTDGAHDLSIGFKLKLLEQDGLVPHFGILASMNIPVGSDVVSPGDVEPGAILLWAYDLTDEVALAGNVGFASLTDAGERFFQTSASISLAVALTERLGGYVEYYGLYPNAEDSDAAHTLNCGLTFLINNNFQIDWRIGGGLNEEADDFFTGVGFAWRI